MNTIVMKITLRGWTSDCVSLLTNNSKDHTKHNDTWGLFHVLLSLLFWLNTMTLEVLFIIIITIFTILAQWWNDVMVIMLVEAQLNIKLLRISMIDSASTLILWKLTPNSYPRQSTSTSYMRSHRECSFQSSSWWATNISGVLTKSVHKPGCPNLCHWHRPGPLLN